MRKFKELFVNSFFYCLAIELVEEIIEDIIALGVSVVVTKAVSAVIVVSLTQSTKLVVKKIVKKITYKEGNDKVSKIKSFVMTLWRNKGTIGGIITGGLAVVSGTGVIDVSQFPALMIGGFNLTPWLYYGVIAIVGAWCAFFPESKEQYERRIAERDARKEAKAIEKESKKELAQEKKLANQTQAEQEKAKAKAEAEATAKAEKEKADAEHRAKVEEAKQKLLAQNNNNQNA